MVKIVKLNRFRKDEEAISVLEDLLEKAKSGELTSLLYVDRYLDNTCGYGWTGIPDYLMIGKLRGLEHMFLTDEQED